LLTSEMRNNLLYVCSMIEYVSRVTNNHRSYIVNQLRYSGIRHQLSSAGVNHSLSFEQVADEWIEDYQIKDGSYDTVRGNKYRTPSETEIGKVYQRLIEDTCEGDLIQAVINVFNSFIIDEITYFDSNIYYSNPDYLRCSYEEGKLLA